MKFTYKTTIYSCFIGYVVQAIVNNFIPLLFLTFQNTYHIPLEQITMLVTLNFGTQFIVDMLAAKFADRIGYRISIVSAHVFAAAGLISLTILPEILPNPFVGILLSVMIYAVGGGLLEVLVSPIMESCPTDNKEAAMSLLHSFYCWGHVGVVIISTLFFVLAGIENWKVLALIWAVIPVLNGFILSKTPIAPLIADGERGMTLKELFSNKAFWILILMMFASGASEQAVSQWASVFAEKGLGISKAAGDLAGPMAFAIFMGSARAFYGKYGDRIDLHRYMFGSGVLGVIAYLMISLVPSPVMNLIGCALCGFSAGIMWPGSFSTGSAVLKNGGTVMFAVLALAGDIGCGSGPTLVGFVSSYFNENLKAGILLATIFPALMLICLLQKKYIGMKKNEVK